MSRLLKYHEAIESQRTRNGDLIVIDERPCNVYQSKKYEREPWTKPQLVKHEKSAGFRGHNKLNLCRIVSAENPLSLELPLVRRSKTSAKPKVAKRKLKRGSPSSADATAVESDDEITFRKKKRFVIDSDTEDDAPAPSRPTKPADGGRTVSPKWSPVESDDDDTPLALRLARPPPAKQPAPPREAPRPQPIVHAGKTSAHHVPVPDKFERAAVNQAYVDALKRSNLKRGSVNGIPTQPKHFPLTEVEMAAQGLVDPFHIPMWEVDRSPGYPQRQFTTFDYQDQAAIMLAQQDKERKGILVLMGTGLGKTVLAASAVSYFSTIVGETRPVDRVYYVCPKSVVEAAKVEMSMWFSINWIVVGYDEFSGKHLEGAKGQILVVDEAHSLRNAIVGQDGDAEEEEVDESLLDEAQDRDLGKFRNIVKAISRSRKTILLTGTPCSNRLSDISVLLNVLNPPRLKLSTDIDKFCRTVRNEAGGKDYVVRNPELLAEAMHQTVLYKRIDPGTEGVPKIQTSLYQVRMFSEQASEYKKATCSAGGEAAANNLVDMATGGSKPKKKGGSKKRFNPNAFLNKVRQICNGVKVDGRLISPKLNLLASLAREDLQGGNKGMVFMEHTDGKIALNVTTVLNRMADVFGKDKVASITGKTTPANRRSVVTRFNDGDLKLCVFSGAAAEGLDLKGCTHVYIMNPMWSYGALQQVRGRAVRKMAFSNGSDATVNVTVLQSVAPLRTEGRIGATGRKNLQACDMGDDFDSADVRVWRAYVEKERVIKDFIKDFIVPAADANALKFATEDIDRQDELIFSGVAKRRHRARRPTRASADRGPSSRRPSAARRWRPRR
jgi:hypothetical protein